MGFLSKLFGAASKEERNGLYLGRDAYWKVSAPGKLPSFLRAIHIIAPIDAILYIESGSRPVKEIMDFLVERCVPEVTHIAMGTIWPRPQVYHLPATYENLAQLADLSEKCHALQVAIHLHLYIGNIMLLEWYDAFCKCPMYVSEEVPEDKLGVFCSELSLEYNKCGKNDEPSGGVIQSTASQPSAWGWSIKSYLPLYWFGIVGTGAILIVLSNNQFTDAIEAAVCSSILFVLTYLIGLVVAIWSVRVTIRRWKKLSVLDRILAAFPFIHLLSFITLILLLIFFKLEMIGIDSFLN